MLKFIGAITVVAVLAFGGLYVTGNLSGSADVQLTQKGKQNVNEFVQQAKEGSSVALEKARSGTVDGLDKLQAELSAKPEK